MNCHPFAFLVGIGGVYTAITNEGRTLDGRDSPTDLVSLADAVDWADPVTRAEITQGIKHLHSLAQPQDFAGEKMAWDEGSLPSNISYIAQRLQALNNLASTVDPLAKQISELKTTITRQQDIGAQKEARICALERQVRELQEERTVKVLAMQEQIKDQANVIAQKEARVCGFEGLVRELQAQKQELIQSKEVMSFKCAFNKLQHLVHTNAKDHGWHEVDRAPVERFGVFLANVHAELSEAWEVVRKDWRTDSAALPGHLALVEELADVVIRIMDTCGAQGWNLADAIVSKHDYNTIRPHRHGGKQA